MRNAPFHPDYSTTQHHATAENQRRFRLLAILFLALLMIVLLRFAWVQLSLPDSYRSALNATTVEYEPIPARDGRILGENGEVFATDVDLYSVEIHYRWLQSPVSEDWLKRESRRRLTGSERRDASLVEQVRIDSEQQREHMWENVCRVCGISTGAFNEKRNGIQTRVQRIADSVNRRRQEKFSNPPEPSLLMKWATALRSSLTSTPKRTKVDRIIVKEEESYHSIVSNVPLTIAAAIREQPHRFPGVRVTVSNQRQYPQQSLASHIIGVRTIQTDSSAKTQRTGRSGVERSYQLQLQSIPGQRRIVRNRRQQIVTSEVATKPVPGQDILLTINPALQQHAESLLAEALTDQPQHLLAEESASQQGQPVPTGGCIVIMNCNTGRLATVASAPTYSLDLFAHGTKREWDAVNADQRKPFVSRAIQMCLAPGSALKPVTAIAALESGQLNPDEPFFCQGFLNQPDQLRCLIYRRFQQGHQSIRLKDALAQSCNVYFFDAARRTKFYDLRLWCEKFGLQQSTGVDLPFEQSGNLPGRSAKDRSADSETLGLSIGQSSVTASPLQMARIFAAIANGGWLVTPHVVSPDGMARQVSDIDDRPQPIVRRRIPELSEESLAAVREGLEAAVQNSRGTGYRTIRLADIAIAGKTGTAETGSRKADHAWFAGYLPAKQPEYAIVVVLEHGGSAGQAAGPLVRSLVRQMIAQGLVSSTQTPTGESGTEFELDASAR